ncbi:MAG: hypothetical protein ACE5KA_03975 [Nitrososphaerales archaeon]
MQPNQPTLMHELLTLGVLKQQNGQIVLDGGFHEVLQTEMCRTRADQKRSIATLMQLYFPNLETGRIINYAAFLEAYILQN